MRFLSDKEIQNHPQACLIPKDILYGQFGNMLSELHLDLMQTPFADLAPRITELKKHTRNDQSRYWMCIAWGHPSASDEELTHLALEFGLTIPELVMNAARFGRLSMINRITKEAGLTALQIQDIITVRDYGAFRWAAAGGHLPVIEKLLELAPTLVDEMITADDFVAFRLAASGGHLSVMDKLKTLAPDHISAMIEARNYEPFRKAAQEGHLPVLEWLRQLAPAQLPKMIKAGGYGAFRVAAAGGHLAIIEHLITLAPTEVQHMIKAKNYEAFRRSARGGHIAMMNLLIVLAPTELQNMIKVENYDVFQQAAEGGHLHIMERLMALAPNEVLNMIKANDYAAFRMAAFGGQLEVMEKLLALLPPDDQLSMIQAGNYGPFEKAAMGGQLPIIEKLITLAPAEVQNMIQADNYSAFRMAARCGHLAIMERLIALATDNVLNMISARGWEAFQFAAQGGHLPMANMLLSFSTVMSFAEEHGVEFSHITYPFITNRLASLRNQRHTLETTNPHAVFDLDIVDEAKSCFYIIRNLIRRNDPAVLDDIRFLIAIPAVKALLHQEVTARAPNELVCLAISTGNQGAAEILLTIPAVRELAARHNYYRAEERGALDLGRLAQDRESSMHALSTGEQERIAAAIERYQPIMHAAGVKVLFDHLLEELADRYQKNPAKLTVDGKEISLPLDWEAFTHLSLSDTQCKDALKAYYQQKDHCALRYLSCPNNWMAHDASYVYINEEHTLRWSTFEDYKPLITMLWLAAQDKTIAPTDGHTLEGRITHFIDELAQIGRAHNWDHSRNRIDSGGHSIAEEYDDLAGDKPSCFSGVKRRLFQSVIGHPLLKMLTEQDIQQELRDFVRGHFTHLINDENRGFLFKAWNDFCVNVELVDAEPLKMLNISPEQQALFIHQLTDKYGRQFSGDIKFKSIITTAFHLAESTSNPSDCMHALKLAALSNLEQLLAPAVVAAAAGAGGVTDIGFFASDYTGPEKPSNTLHQTGSVVASL